MYIVDSSYPRDVGCVWKTHHNSSSRVHLSETRLALLSRHFLFEFPVRRDLVAIQLQLIRKLVDTLTVGLKLEHDVCISNDDKTDS